jgi:hypothetical protein
MLLLLTIPTMCLLAFLSTNHLLPPPFVITSTRYAPGYSHSSFRKMQLGTPIQTVRNALGEPLQQFTNESRETWMIYSFHKGGRTPFYFKSCWFKSRILVVSNGVVVERFSFINDD